MRNKLIKKNIFYLFKFSKKKNCPVLLFLTWNHLSELGVGTLPDIRSGTEPDPKNPNQNPNRSSKIPERVLNKERLDTRTRTDNTRTRMDIRR